MNYPSLTLYVYWLPLSSLIIVSSKIFHLVHFLPLHRLGFVDLLLQYGADVEAQDPNYDQRLTPLLCLASGFHEPGDCHQLCNGMEILLKRGANLLCTTTKAITPWAWLWKRTARLWWRFSLISLTKTPCHLTRSVRRFRNMRFSIIRRKRWPTMIANLGRPEEWSTGTTGANRTHALDSP